MRLSSTISFKNPQLARRLLERIISDQESANLVHTFSPKTEAALRSCIPPISEAAAQKILSDALAIMGWTFEREAGRMVALYPRQQPGLLKSVTRLRDDLQKARGALQKVATDRILRVSLTQSYYEMLRLADEKPSDADERGLVSRLGANPEITDFDADRPRVDDLDSLLAAIDFWKLAAKHLSLHLDEEIEAGKALGVKRHSGRPPDNWSRPAICLLAVSWMHEVGTTHSDKGLPEPSKFEKFANTFLSDLGLPHAEGKSFRRQIAEVLQGKFTFKVQRLPEN